MKHFWDGFEKRAHGWDTTYAEFEEHAKKHHPEAHKKLTVFNPGEHSEKEVHRFEQEMQPAWDHYLKDSDHEMAERTRDEWKKQKDLGPDLGLKEGLKGALAGLPLGAFGGGMLGGVLSSPLRLLGPKGRTAANVITGGSALGLGLAGAKSLHDFSRKNRNHGLSKEKLEEQIQRDSNRTATPRLEYGYSKQAAPNAMSGSLGMGPAAPKMQLNWKPNLGGIKPVTSVLKTPTGAAGKVVGMASKLMRGIR